MPELPLLLPVQQELLIAMVEATESVPPERQAYFTIQRIAEGPSGRSTFLRHPGFAQSIPVFLGDLEVLADRRLLLFTEGRSHMTLLPEAYAYYGEIKQPPPPTVRAAVRGVTVSALAQATRALYVFEHAAAIYGSAELPAHIAIQMENKRKEIDQLKARLAALDAADNEMSA